MEAKARARFIKVSPRKARIVADLVRGMDVSEALTLLSFTRRSAAGPIKKLVESAVANAKQASSAVDVDSLYIKQLTVDMGPAKNMRRWRPRAMGRATRVVKGMSHLNVVLDIR
ncbi:MAG: 50S ribosomal protein L22 [Proteobacteria bacterium]|nr:50S ribosomal protein L22 [Pseudomonadota bacterium]